MATSSTLKTLKQQDGSIGRVEGPAPVRSNALAGRLQTLWRSIWRRRWLFLATAWLICTAGWAAIALWPTQFVASAVIHADLAVLVDPETDAAAGTDRTPSALLKSMLVSGDAIAAVRSDLPLDAEAIRSLENDVMLRATVPPLFVLAYEHERPEVARTVVETIVEGFRSHVDTASKVSPEDDEALDADIADRERRLQTAEADLVAFRRGNDDYLGGGEDTAAELAVLEEDTASLENLLRERIAERDGIATELAKARAPDADTAGIGPTKSREEIEAERQALDAQLASLKERYADSHPYVTAVVDEIDRLQVETLALEASPDDTTDLAPPDRDALEQRHGELIAEVSTLTTRLGDKRREFEALQALTKTAGSVEAELAELEAGRDALRDELLDLQRRRDEIANYNGGEAGQEPFRLIRRPELPSDPVGPSRLMALAAVLLGGAGVGASAAVIRNRFKGVFESAWQLRQRFDVGVLGTIAEVMTPAEKKRLDHSRLVFGLACLALVGVFGGLAIAELTDSLAPFGERLRSRISG